MPAPRVGAGHFGEGNGGLRSEGADAHGRGCDWGSERVEEWIGVEGRIVRGVGWVEGRIRSGRGAGLAGRHAQGELGRGVGWDFDFGGLREAGLPQAGDGLRRRGEIVGGGEDGVFSGGEGW